MISVSSKDKVHFPLDLIRPKDGPLLSKACLHKYVNASKFK